MAAKETMGSAMSGLLLQGEFGRTWRAICDHFLKRYCVVRKVAYSQHVFSRHPSTNILLIRLRDTTRCAAKADTRPRSAEIHD